MITRDVRICFTGGSLVAGYGDQRALGWVGRVLARTDRDGMSLTAYNLGVRGARVVDVDERLVGECGPRLDVECDERRVVLQVGLDDLRDGRAPASVARELARLAETCLQRGWSPFVVGNPPLLDEHLDPLVRSMDTHAAADCAGLGVPHVPVARALVDAPPYRASLRGGDGVHPDQVGYGLLAYLVLHAGWSAWLGLPEPAAAPVRRPRVRG